MKIIAHTAGYGGRTQVSIAWTRGFFFENPQPEPNRLITLEMPGLAKLDADHVSRWLSSRSVVSAVKALVSSKRREIQEFRAEDWKYTVLDDFLDAKNYDSFYWYIAQHFSLAEILEFETAHMPTGWTAAREALRTPEDDLVAREAALARMQEIFQRTHTAAYGAMNRVQIERNQLQERLDRQVVAAFDATLPQPISAWVALVTKLETMTVQREALMRLARRIVDETHDSLALLEIFEDLAKSKKIRDALTYYPQFWGPIQPWLNLPANVRGATVDISNALEVVVPLHLTTLTSKRIGNIVPGRRALCIPAPSSGKPPTFIRATRQLQFQIMERGGTIKKHGCTLKVDMGGNSIRPLLTQVEELIVLANLAPERALEKVADLNLPADHPIHGAAARARDDHRYARILADLLIEERTGLDADVARRLVG